MRKYVEADVYHSVSQSTNLGWCIDYKVICYTTLDARAVSSDRVCCSKSHNGNVIFSDFDPLIPRGSKKEFLTWLFVSTGNRHEM